MASSAITKHNIYQNKLAKQEAFYDSMDTLIQRHLETNPTVIVDFHFTFADDRQTEKKARNADIETRKTINQEFVIKNVIEPMADGVLRWKSFSSTIKYIAEVDKAGYEKLKNNKYVKWIQISR